SSVVRARNRTSLLNHGNIFGESNRPRYRPPQHNTSMSSIGKLMKQETRMQQQMERIQQDLAAKTVEAVAGGGAVKVVARCDQTLQSIKIAPEAVNPSDVAFLEDLVLTATNQ